MAGRALLALLGLCVGLVAGAQDGVWQGFDLLKFSGLWYEIAVASKTGPQSPPPRMKTGAVLVELEGSRLALTAAYYDENTCVKEKDGASLGDGLGKFKVIRTASKPTTPR
ncbi:epididymal-specific lipocalin-5-like [Tupaia chinensis]|uniref:epididymal-specific lipocalin-5-like n=1 Tax=Tupaia chinensis TaxID=246437 RepID=UPI0003C90444|nr:epididymal-specific lipocalin-5-like [Tupaia chinensis]